MKRTPIKDIKFKLTISKNKILILKSCKESVEVTNVEYKDDGTIRISY